MILILLLSLAAAAIVAAAGVPWPLAIVGGLFTVWVANLVYLRATNQNAPYARLTPDDLRTRRFLAMLVERYRAERFAVWADALDEILIDYDAGRIDAANHRFDSVSRLVSHSPNSTDLIHQWQATWRDAAKDEYGGGPGGRRAGAPHATAGADRIDLDRDELRELNAAARQNLPTIVAGMPHLPMELKAIEYGNIGARRGQYAAFAFQLGRRLSDGASARHRAEVAVVRTMLPHTGAVQEARIWFVDSTGAPVSKTTIDMSAASALSVDAIDVAVEAYVGSHRR